jgi:arabinose-5-phosphate isomerase
MRDLFKKQKSHIDYFFDKLDYNQAERFVEFCLDVKGLLVLTGVGKSGIVAEKVAMTLSSTGTRAIHLPPTNFLHGDLGILTRDDLVIFFSKSGETEELYGLIPFIQKKGAKLAALVCNPESRLAKSADCFVCLPVERELCPFDLAPTTSTAVQALFGDVFAVALMKAKAFSIVDYALNHPAGAIGKKMSTTVDMLMFQGDKVPLATRDRILSEVLDELTEKKCGCLVIVDENQALLGILTDGDLRRALQAHGPSVLQKSIHELMTYTAISIPQETLAWEALKVMQKDPRRWISVLPVLDRDRKVIGLIRMHDIIQSGIG